MYAFIDELRINMRFIGVLLLLLATVPSAALAATDGPWTGTWDTRWRGGGARLELHQSGDKVDGKYASYNGLVTGTAVGRLLKGSWSQGPRSGAFEFVLSSDGKSFVGRYESGEWWTGARISVDPRAASLVDLSTPRAAMRTFLHGGNSARYDAPDEMVKSVAAVDFGGASLLPEQKLGKVKAFFDLVDATTFRLFAIPDKATGDRAAVTLHQLGTNAELPVQFSRTGDRWQLVIPDDAALATFGKGLYARYGGHPPGPDEYLLRRTACDAYRTFTHAFYDWDNGGRAQAISALDLSAVPQAIRDYQGDLAAQYIAGILNRVGLLEPQEVPDDPDSVQPYVLFSSAAGQIALAPTGSGKQKTWAFSKETVRDARDLFVVVEDLPPIEGGTLPPPPSAFFGLRKFIRGAAPQLLTAVGPLEAWQLVGWAAILVVSLGLGFVLTELVMRLALKILGTRDRKRDLRTFRFAVWGAIGFSLYKLIIPSIGLLDVAKQISVGTTGILLVASLMWLGWITIDALGNRFFGSHDGKQVTMDNIVVSLLFGLVKLALMIVGFTLIAIELSLPYEGIIASLSIGGLAVAFASRETLSNVFGAGVLAIDRPFKRGDFISAGGVDGTVEHVGIRSTRVRTNDDSLIIIPNGKLSDAFVNNLGSRRYHLSSLKLPLAFSTSVTQLEKLMDGARKIVDAVPQVSSQRTSLALSPIGVDGIQLALTYSIDVSRGGNETAITNQLFLDVLSLCERLQIRTALRGTDALGAELPVV